MSEKTGVEKLRILLPHWIEHNDSHIAEFAKWQQVIAEETGGKASEKIGEAVAAMEKAGKVLSEALTELGGGLEGHHHHHHGH
jgi:hypothetical protein